MLVYMRVMLCYRVAWAVATMSAPCRHEIKGAERFVRLYEEVAGVMLAETETMR